MIRVEKATKSYGGLLAVAGANASFPVGQISLLVGPNGSGKSTLLDMISGVLPFDNGDIYVGSRSVRGSTAAQLSRAGLARTFQKPRVVADLTVAENILLNIETEPPSKVWWQRCVWWLQAGRDSLVLERVEAYARDFDLDASTSTRAGMLSYGQQKLLSLCCALIRQPQWLLLDEPLGGVSSDLVHRLLVRLKALAEDGCTVLIVEHNIAVFAPYADFMFVMDAGRVVLSGTSQEIRLSPRLAEVFLR